MITDILTKLASLNKGRDGDWSDRLNSLYTSRLLVCLGILVTTRQFVGDTIICFGPNEFNGQWNNYMDAYCWVSNTQYMPLNSHHDAVIDGYERVPIRYYQWTPLILLLQAGLFAFPGLLWRSMYQSAGIDFVKITETASKFETVIDSTAWNTVVGKLSKHIDRYLELQKEYNPSWWRRVGSCLNGRLIVSVSRHYGNYLTCAYPLIKIVFLINILFQYYMLCTWLGHEYQLYGWNVVLAVWDGQGIQRVTNIFPRVTWCNLDRRIVEKVVNYQMHCVLPINLFNEMVFLIVWYWMLVVFIATTIMLFRWCLRCTFQPHIYIKKHLKFNGRLRTTEEKRLVRKFITGYLKPDGVFIIRVLAKNTSSIFISDLLVELFDTFLAKQREGASRENDLHSPNEEPDLELNFVASEHKDLTGSADCPYPYRYDYSPPPPASSALPRLDPPPVGKRDYR